MQTGNYNDVINELQDYMLDNERIQTALKSKIIHVKTQYVKREDVKMQDVKREDVKMQDVKTQDVKIKTQEVKETEFIPQEQDTLFWCYYKIVHGDASYETLNNKNSLVAKQMKIELVSLIRKHKDIVKTYKFDTITNIESNLANDNILNIKTFLSLCAIANINVIYINKKTFFESFMNDTDVVYIIREHLYKKYGYELSNQEQINTIRESLYKLDKIDKPIKAISAYKVEEIIAMSKRLSIDTIHKETGKNKSKKDLYEAIVQYF